VGDGVTCRAARHRISRAVEDVALGQNDVQQWCHHPVSGTDLPSRLTAGATSPSASTAHARSCSAVNGGSPSGLSSPGMSLHSVETPATNSLVPGFTVHENSVPPANGATVFPPMSMHANAAPPVGAPHSRCSRHKGFAIVWENYLSDRPCDAPRFWHDGDGTPEWVRQYDRPRQLEIRQRRCKVDLDELESQWHDKANAELTEMLKAQARYDEFKALPLIVFARLK
jgi:hypothetical protein